MLRSVKCLLRKYEELNSHPQVRYKKLDVAMHACDLSPREEETGESQRLPDFSLVKLASFRFSERRFRNKVGSDRGKDL